MDDRYELNPYRALINRDEPKKTITIKIKIHDFVQWTREQSTYDSVVFSVRTGKERLPEKDKSIMADWMYEGDELILHFNDPNDMA